MANPEKEARRENRRLALKNMEAAFERIEPIRRGANVPNPDLWEAVDHLEQVLRQLRSTMKQ